MSIERTQTDTSSRCHAVIPGMRRWRAEPASHATGGERAMPAWELSKMTAGPAEGRV